MTPQTRFRVYYTLFVLSLGALSGLLLGAWLHRPAEPALAHATYQPAQRQPDGSLQLERQPVLEAKPAQQVPAGATVTGVARVTAKPRPVSQLAQVGKLPSSEVGKINMCSCDPVTVDVTTIRTDAGPGLVTSSPDGEITGGVYQPVIGEMVRPERRHALGLTWRRDGATGDDVGGVVYQYDWGRLRLGATLEYQDQYGAQPGAQIIYRFN